MESTLNPTATPLKKATGTRLLSLDVMRGMTIVCMIIVNNGAGPESFAHLEHSVWNGITVCDLVFPFFLFIMGITTYISLRKFDFHPSSDTVAKILRRTASIILVGWAVHWFSNICYGKPVFDFSHFRLTGVLTRIALCYGITAIMALYLSRRAMAAAAAALLAIYGAMLLMFNGYANDASNINVIIDKLIVGENHLYTRQPVDPEGLLGTLPSVAHTIIGFCCGAILLNKRPLESRLLNLFLVATALLVGGFLISGILPENKRIWSPSYVLLTCGMAAALLAAITSITDLRSEFGKRNPATKMRGLEFFEAFGVNPLFLYVLGGVFGIILGSTGLKHRIFDFLFSVAGYAPLASLIYAVSLMLLCGAVGLPLFRRKIYIKV